MKTTSIQTKVAGFCFAVLMSATILGATVAGMLSGSSNGSEVVTLDRMVVAAPATTAVN
jgi:hypothetical protein